MSMAVLQIALMLALIPIQIDSVDCPQREDVERALAAGIGIAHRSTAPASGATMAS
jgi:hypothetical protein